MLQNELVTVQRRIQETCYRKVSLGQYVTARKRSLLSQKAYFRCAMFMGLSFTLLNRSW